MRWEYAVLVTNMAYPLVSVGQLYRDRADETNVFDELKNWQGLGGFGTQGIGRRQTRSPEMHAGPLLVKLASG